MAQPDELPPKPAPPSVPGSVAGPPPGAPPTTPGDAAGATPAGPRLALSPYYQRRLAEVEVAPPKNRPELARLFARLPVQSPSAAEVAALITDESVMRRVLSALVRQQVAYASLGVVARYESPGVLLRDGRTWHDPRSIRPQLAALVLAATGHGGVRLQPYVLDCRVPAVQRALGSLLTRPWTYVVHGADEVLFSLWQMGIPAPQSLWDTRVAERSLSLGLHHPGNTASRPADAFQEIRARQQAAEDAEAYCDLTAACRRYGVPCPWAGQENRLVGAVRERPTDEPFTEEEGGYLAGRALAAARLYPLQVEAATAANALHHLKEVEMPWVVPNARMTWDGVLVDAGECQKLLGACRRHEERLVADLAALGISDPNNNEQLKAYFGRAGLLASFHSGGGLSFDDEHLKAVEGGDAVARQVRDLRKVRRLQADKVLTGELVGADGRLHPEHVQLGAATGRNTMRAPNVGGVGRALRPLVVAEQGHGVGEVDLCQIEVMIAAAVYGDVELIGLVNRGDVYTGLAKRYYAGRLSPEDLALPDNRFKKRHRSLRDRMKVFVLAVIYGITPLGLSFQLGVPEEEAAAERDRFLGLFPALAGGLREAADVGAVRGYAELCSGLRRNRAREGTPTPWECNWLTNTPVQGSGMVVFKAAGIRLYRRYQHYGARLLLPMHDAFVFEAPLPHLQAVAKATAEELRAAVQVYFPELEPRVEINIDHPSCWNKDGKWQSLHLWMTDPRRAREYLES
jgi:DNA polymerase-1